MSYQNIDEQRPLLPHHDSNNANNTDIDIANAKNKKFWQLVSILGVVGLVGGVAVYENVNVASSAAVVKSNLAQTSGVSRSSSVIAAAYDPENTDNKLDLVVRSTSTAVMAYSGLPEDDTKALFTHFKTKYNKEVCPFDDLLHCRVLILFVLCQYQDDTEETNRFEIFKDNLAVIDSRNALELERGGRAMHGITKFTDYSKVIFLFSTA
jgi:hypothetical protein